MNKGQKTHFFIGPFDPCSDLKHLLFPFIIIAQNI